MKKFLLVLVLASSTCLAQQTVPDRQISITTNTLSTIKPTLPLLSSTISWLDANIATTAGLATRTTTNQVVGLVSNTAPSVISNFTWMVTSTNLSTTYYKTVTPRFKGDELLISNTNSPTTNVLYRAIGTTTNNWAKIYSGS